MKSAKNRLLANASANSSKRRSHHKRAFRSLTIEQFEAREMMAVRVWTGAGDGINWATAANWDANAVPTSDDVAQFTGLDVGTIDLNGAQTVGGVTFTAGGYTIQNGNLALGAVSNSAGTNTLSAQLTAPTLTGSVTGGQLNLTNVANSSTLLGGTWTVASGGKIVTTTSNANTGVGKANVDLTGGTLEFGPGAPVTVNGLTERWYPNLFTNSNLIIDAVAANNTDSYPALVPDSASLLTTNLGNFNTAALVARSPSNLGAFGNKFGAGWFGQIVVGGSLPVGNVSLGTNSDDGSAIYVDVNSDGVFQASELVVDNRNDHGGQSRIGTVNLPTAGSYNVYIGYFESSGGGNMEARYAAGSAIAYDSQTIINPTTQAGVWKTQVIEPGSLTNDIRVSADSTIIVGATLPGVKLDQLIVDAGRTLLVHSADTKQDLEFASVVLGGNATINSTGTPDITLRNISETAAAGLTYSGNAIVFLPTASTYTGLTTINSGVTVSVSANSALGTADAGTDVLAGGALRLTGAFNYATAEALKLSGNGTAAADAALQSLSGDKDFRGPITLTAGARIRSAANALRLYGQVDNAGQALELRANGSIEIHSGISGSGVITKTGGDRVIIHGVANAGTTFTGQLNVNEGIWDARASNALGTTAAGTVVANGARLELRDGITLADNISVMGNSGGNGVIRSDNNTNTLSGVVTLAAASQIWVNATQLTISQAIQGNQFLTKAGTGLLILPQDNLLSNFDLAGGAVRISTLNGLGSTTFVSVDPGESLEFNGNLTFGAGAALQNIQVSNGTLTSVSGSTVLETTQIKLGLAGGINFAGAGNLTIHQAFGNGALDTATALGGVTGNLALWLDASDLNADGVPDSLANGAAVNSWSDKSGLGRDANVVQNNPILNTNGLNGRPVVNFTNDRLQTTYNFDGLGANYTIFAVSRYTGGDNERVVSSQTRNWLFGHHQNRSDRWHAEGWIYQGTGANDNDLSWGIYTGAIGPDADGVPGGAVVADFWSDDTQWVNDGTGFNTGAYKPGQLNLGSYNNNLSESSNAEVAEVIIFDRVLSDADRVAVETYLNVKYRTATNHLTKNGTGTVTLLGANTYNGATTINAGTLIAGNAATGGLGLASAGTVVKDGATLGFANGATVVGENITVNGAGAAGQPGAIVNISGANSYTGTITATAVANSSIGIGATAGTLTLNGTIDQQYSQLVFNGTGDVIVNSTISGVGGSGLAGGLLETFYKSFSFPTANDDAQDNIEGIRNTALGANDGRGILTGDLHYANNTAVANRALGYGAASFATNTGWTGTWVTTFTPDESGRWGFRFGGVDDDASIWIDTTGTNGTFELTDRIYSRACCGGSGDQLTPPLVAGQKYLVGIAARDFNAGSFTDAQFRSPTGAGITGGNWVRINAANYPTTFQTLAVANNALVKNGTGTVTLAGNNTYNGVTTINAGVLVAANNNALGAAAAATTVVKGATLGLSGGITLAGDVLNIDGTGALIDTDNNGTLDTALGALVSLSGTNAVTNTIVVKEVSLGEVGIGASGGATLNLNTNLDLRFSKLTVNGAGNTNITGVVSGIGMTVQNIENVLPATGFAAAANQLYHFGYHVNNDAATLNLHNNGGAYNSGNPTTFPAFEGAGLLTNGPGNRGLDFNDPDPGAADLELVPASLQDDASLDGFVINQDDQYSNLFVGFLNVSAENAGTWNFRINDHDDPAGIWIDLNRDGIFQTGNGSVSDANGELIAFNGGCCAQRDLKSINLAEGSYRIAITHREGGGGSTLDITFGVPGKITERSIKPTDPAQDGIWSTRTFRETFADNSLIKNGTGTLTLSAANTYNGTTTINGGVVAATNLANGGAASSIGLSSNAATNLVLDGGTLRYIGATAAVIDRSFTLGANGGTLDSSGANANAVMSFNNTGAIAFSGSGARTLTLTGNNVGGAQPSTIAGVIGNGAGGNVSLVKSGTGTWALSGNNTYAGTTTVNTGTLQIGVGGTTGSLSSATAVTVNSPGTLLYNRNDSAAEVDIGHTVSGNGAWNFTSPGGTQVGRFQPTGNNAGFTGTIGLTNSRLNVTSANQVGTAAITINPGSQLLANGAVTIANPVTLNSLGWVENAGNFGGMRLRGATLSGPITLAGNSSVGNLGGESGTISGAIGGTGNLAFVNPQTTLSNITLSGAASNTYVGTTTVAGRAVLNLAKTGGAIAIPGNVNFGDGSATINPYIRMSQNNQFGATSVVNFLNAVNGFTRFELQGTSQTLAGISGSLGGGIIQNSESGIGGTGVLTINNNADFAYNGYIRNATGAVSIVKTGNGVQTLSGPQISYTGATTINAGTLKLANTTAFASAITVNPTATLQLANEATNNATGFTMGAAAPINLNGGTLLYTSSNFQNTWVVLNSPVTASAPSTINVAPSNSTNTGLYFDGGLVGSATTTINANTPRAGANFRDQDTTFSGTLIVNGIASTTLDAGSGIGVGGNTTSLQNADIQLNGTMELLNQGLGWANTASGAFRMGALSGNGVIIGNDTTAGGVTTVTLGNTNNNGTFTGTIANGANNAIDLVKVGTGTQTLSGAGFDHTGNTTVSDGTLVLSNTSDWKSSIFNNATVELNSTGGNYRLVEGRTLGGSGTYIKTGTGPISLYNAQVTASGNILIQEGTLRNDGNSVNWSGSTANIDVALGAVLDIRADSVRVNSLTGAGSIVNSYGAGGGATDTLTIGVSGGDSLFTGIIGGNGDGQFGENRGKTALSKVGAGTFILTNANTYNGGTTVSAGTLLVNNTTGSGTGSGEVTVGNGGTLGGNGTIGGSVNVNTNGILAPGANANVGTVGTLAIGGALTLNSGSTYQADITAGADDLVTANTILINDANLAANIPAGLPQGSTNIILDALTSSSGQFAGVENSTYPLDNVVTVNGNEIYHLTNGDPANRFPSVVATQVALVRNSTFTIDPNTNLTTNEDIALPFDLVTSDADQDVVITINPTPALDPLRGTVSVNQTTGVITFTPAANFSGLASFSYTVTDGETTFGPTTVNVTVTPVADQPNLTVAGQLNPASVNLSVEENAVLPLPIIAVLTDNNALETPESLTVTISGFLPNMRLNVPGAGTGVFEGSASYTFTGADVAKLSGATIVKLDNEPGDATFPLTITATTSEEVVPPSTATRTTTVHLTVTNVAPGPVSAAFKLNGVDTDLPALGSTLEVTPGTPLSFTVSADDQGPLDEPMKFTITWGDGTTQTLTADQNNDVTFSYNYPGAQPPLSFPLTLTVEDKDGAITTIAQFTVQLSNIVLIDGTLFVGGSSGPDRIIIQSGSGGGVSVRYNNALTKSYSVGNKIVVYGNAGNDTISVSKVNIPVEFYGGAGNDYLAGGSADDILDGGAGDDRLLSGAGDDFLYGGPGNDRLSAGLGSDHVYGDTYLDLSGDEIVPPASQHGRDTLSGEGGDDFLFGEGNNDTINGGLGSDMLRGGDGNDKLSGDDGHDLLVGDLGADKLYGRAGNDMLIGGGGLDTLYGGSGEDLMFGNTFDDDDDTLKDIAMMWFGGLQADAAETIFLADRLPETTTDLLYGETGADWYLLYFGDKITTANDKAPANTIQTITP